MSKYDKSILYTNTNPRAAVADLQSLLAERRRGQLPFSLYKLYDKIDARLRQVSSLFISAADD